MSGSNACLCASSKVTTTMHHKRRRRHWYSKVQPRQQYSLAVSVREHEANDWVVETALGQVVHFYSQAAAWAWIDHVTGEGRAMIDRHARIRDAFSRR